MTASVRQFHVAPRAAARAVATLSVYEIDDDTPLVAIPWPQVQLVARFGPTAHRGLDVHAMGMRATAHRKILRRGHRAVSARLQLGAHEAVLGVPASAIAGNIVALESLWGEASTRRLVDRLAAARDTADAAAILERAIAERIAIGDGRRAHAQLALDAAERLTSANVNAVALALGISERHLRRVFRETLGVSPKTFARLNRFRRALGAANDVRHPSWARIAAASGYYDQAHLIAEFRDIAGVTPQRLLGELRVAPATV